MYDSSIYTCSSWAEYSVSASIMHIMIGLISGILTIHLILTIGV